MNTVNKSKGIDINTLSPYQKVRVELEDGTIWDGEVSEQNTVLINATPEYHDYFEWKYGGGNEFPTPIDNEYSWDELIITNILPL
jgi:hypothetical protein